MINFILLILWLKLNNLFYESGFYFLLKQSVLLIFQLEKNKIINYNFLINVMIFYARTMKSNAMNIKINVLHTTQKM